VKQVIEFQSPDGVKEGRTGIGGSTRTITGVSIA
jgi:hypothetical protein